MVARVRDLCALAVDAALGAGASYADARVVVRRSQRVATKGGRVDAVRDVESEGIGVRGLGREAPRIAEQAAALLRADECPAGRTTVVLDAGQLQLQLHESVGHPIELDRVYGFEASYAGTSFLRPEDLGSLRYGS